MVMSRDQNVRRKTNNISFERVVELKYLATTVSNQISIQDEIENRLKSRDVCYH